MEKREMERKALVDFFLPILPLFLELNCWISIDEKVDIHRMGIMYVDGL
jgi:hypothetical protein